MRKNLLKIIIISSIIQIFIFTAAADVNADLLNGPYQKSWELDIPLESADLSPYGEFIVINTGSEIKIIDVKTGKDVHSINSPSQDCQLTTSGDYVVANNYYNIILYDKNLNRIGSYEYEDEQDIIHLPGFISISPSSKNILATSGIKYAGNDFPTKYILYYFELQNANVPTLIWEKEFKRFAGVRKFSMNEEGDLIAIDFQSTRSKIIDGNGNDIKEFEGIHHLKISPDGNHVVGLKDNSIINIDLNNYNTIWETIFLNESGNYWKSLDYENNYNYVVSYANYFVILNSQGEIIQKNNLDQLIKEVKISLDGKYLFVIMNNKIALFSNTIPQIKFPQEKTVIEGQLPIFSWEDNGALNYFIKLDSNIFEVSDSIFTINDSISNGQHEWSVKAIYGNGEESIWTNPTTFYYFSDPIPHLTFPEESEIIKEENITFKWKYQDNAVKYSIDISGEIYESFNEELIISRNSFSPGMYEWSVKAIRPDGSESSQSLPRTFSISAINTENIIKKELKTISQLNQKITFTVSILIFGVITIFVRPYYKRFRIKRKMVKTPTDWCPYCQKFTNGKEVCPHCGKVSNKKSFYFKNGKKNEK